MTNAPNILDPLKVLPGLVVMGADITYRDDMTGKIRRVTLVYPHEADIDANKIKVLTPIGAALISLSVSQSIKSANPSGPLAFVNCAGRAWAGCLTPSGRNGGVLGKFLLKRPLSTSESLIPCAKARSNAPPRRPISPSRSISTAPACRNRNRHRLSRRYARSPGAAFAHGYRCVGEGRPAYRFSPHR